MIHIIFVMLKFTGIVIGLLLGFLLCTVLALLFVPVRYRVGAVKQGEKQQLKIGLSWMLRMVSVAVSGGRKEETKVLIRLFGFRLPFFGGKKPEKDRRKKKKRKNSGTFEHGQRTKKKKSPEIKAENRNENKNDRLPDYGGRNMTHSDEDEYADAGLPDENPDLPGSKIINEVEDIELQDEDMDNGPAVPESSEEDQETAGRKGYTQKSSRIFRQIRRCLASVRRIPDRIAALWKKITALWRGLLFLGKKPAQMKRAFEEQCEKISAFFRMIEEYEIKEICGSLYGEAIHLLSHYKPRRIRGYLRFGAGDPALTGYLTGLIYLLLPARADQFSVMPDFHDTVFETEMIFTGYIRSVHLGCTAWHVFRDRRVRRVFHRNKA